MQLHHHVIVITRTVWIKLLITHYSQNSNIYVLFN